jgi:hypothetical protein
MQIVSLRKEGVSAGSRLLKHSLNSALKRAEAGLDFTLFAGFTTSAGSRTFNTYSLQSAGWVIRR